jgi:pyridoxamine 5'-phosphate oxidase
MAGHEIDAVRASLMAAGLSEDEVPGEPFGLFDTWLARAEAEGVHEPRAMTLATVDEHGDPDARAVLLREATASGFVFFTDRSSAKGRQLAARSRAAIVVLWTELSRQVRAAGEATLLDDAESDAYWATRPRGSQIAAVVSHQSSVLADRDELERRYAEAEEEWRDRSVARPARWGGYRLVPERIEFWQGREFRAHDRLRYVRTGTGGSWRIERLSP